MNAFVRRHWLWITFGPALTASAAGIAVEDGTKPLIVIAAAAFGVPAVVAATAYVSGSSVVKHANTHQAELPGVERQVRALEAQRRKESSK